ncbi:C6 transcription factor (Acr-2) [Aspergillus campestris IBT 28561]|uniref:C6 transcription factor (Acr-2) n=1 Tax=Aspergillus campestris (strain IBT 28561) TaxID=1392248 RepID=A0A2I1DHQ4_ASPC2|nr:C6 transcription factor (Acr-2) [Aspergillus campestris IBT 28561]PKY09405.1 C6 transcription factor (Acr-2) [Aspergillus campestris IBT 28561]
MSEPCYTCRRRRIQCDRSKEPCLKCEKAGLECFRERPLRWVRGVAIRGSMRGKSFKETARPQVENPGQGSMQLIVDAGPNLNHDIDCDALYNASAYGRPNSMGLTMSALSTPNLDPTSMYYLDYYNDRICKVFIVYDSEKNPFRSLISLAMGDSVLLQTILALAARHRANTGRSFSEHHASALPESADAHQAALRFKHRSIQGLANALSDPKACQRDTTVATTFLLVFLDLLESGCDRWNYHLDGAKTMMAMMKPDDPGSTIQGIRQFLATQIHLIETLGTTFVRPKLLSRFLSLNGSGARLRDIVEQSFLGCPGYLLSAIQFFSSQRDILAEENDITRPSPDQSQEVGSVLESVRNFDSYLWATELPQEPSAPRDIDGLCTLSRAYQLGACIYGQCVLDVINKTTTSQHTTVAELISVIGALRDDTALFKCILWPMFIAGLVCQEQAHRDYLIASLERFWNYTSCLNVLNAAQILQAYWTQDTTGRKPSQWIFTVGRLGRDWLLI